MIRLVAGLIDVFADASLTGNPLAVVEGADALPDETLRRIAREFNQAETTFLIKSDRGDRKLRSFTASGAEVFGAGHNALGAWLWLAEHGDLGPLDTPTTFQQEIGGDLLPITLEARGGRIRGRMQQSALRLSAPLRDLRPLAEALALRVQDLLTDPAPLVGDTGAGHLLVRARDAQSVDAAQPAFVAEIRRAVSVPVIATGGIMDGKDIRAALHAGAAAAQLGTAFLACPESGASPAYKQALGSHSAERTVLTRAFSGKWARGLANEFTAAAEQHPQSVLFYPLQNQLTRPMRQAASQKAKLQEQRLSVVPNRFPV